MNLTVPRVITGDSHGFNLHPLAEVEGGEMSWGILGKTTPRRSGSGWGSMVHDETFKQNFGV